MVASPAEQQVWELAHQAKSDIKKAGGRTERMQGPELRFSQYHARPVPGSPKEDRVGSPDLFRHCRIQLLLARQEPEPCAAASVRTP